MNMGNSKKSSGKINVKNSSTKELTYKEIINELEIDSSNKYLENEEIRKIYRIMYYNKNEFATEKHITKRGDRLIDKFNKFKISFETIDNLKGLTPEEIRQCFVDYGCLTIFLFHIVCGRLTIDNNTSMINLYSNNEILTEDELVQIQVSIKQYEYTEKTLERIYIYLIRIMLTYNKNLNEIIPSDIYECYSGKGDAANATFNVLKTLGYFHENEHYIIRNKTGKRKDYINIEFKYAKYIEIFTQYCKTLDKQDDTDGNKSLNKRPVIQFFNWLSLNSMYFNISELKYNTIEEFVNWLKTYKTVTTHKVYSKKTMNTMLSAFGNFLKFLIQKNYLSIEFVKNFIRKYEYAYKNVPIELFHDMVPMDERKLIEKVVMDFSENKGYPAVPDMLRLLYFCALRPIELTTLRYDCLVGGETNPSLHLHKTKNGDERFIPLVKEAYDIVKKYRDINKKALPIYLKYDLLNEKRLFPYRNRILNKSTLNNIFKKQIVEYNLVNEDIQAKYSLYILRKLRITIWIEAGLSLTTIGELAGHRDIESQNAYYVGKELIMENALKSYMQLYKNFMDILQSENSYEYKPEIDVCEQHDYIEELKKTLLEIDNKSIFDVATKMAYKDYPEFFFPLMNGNCGAMYEEGPDFKCEVMEFPCLDCSDLIDTDNYMNKFDEYLLSLYNSKKMHIKNNLQGLVTRDQGIINKLFIFYQNNFYLNEQEVIEKFKFIEAKTITKRGRKKVNKDGH